LADGICGFGDEVWITRPAPSAGLARPVPYGAWPRAGPPAFPPASRPSGVSPGRRPALPCRPPPDPPCATPPVISVGRQARAANTVDQKNGDKANRPLPPTLRRPPRTRHHLRKPASRLAFIRRPAGARYGILCPCAPPGCSLP